MKGGQESKEEYEEWEHIASEKENPKRMSTNLLLFEAQSLDGYFVCKEKVSQTEETCDKNRGENTKAHTWDAFISPPRFPISKHWNGIVDKNNKAQNGPCPVPTFHDCFDDIVWDVKHEQECHTKLAQLWDLIHCEVDAGASKNQKRQQFVEFNLCTLITD